MNTAVNFELAKLLKEKGFSLYCTWSYWEGKLTPHTPGYSLEDGTTSQENYWKFPRYYAPTIAEVVMWLYEKYGIWISVEQQVVSGSSKIYFISIITKQGQTKEKFPKYNLPTKAYGAAIEYTLNNLI